ncbi:TIGR03943 family protein [Streptomyces sp. NBC_01481]|uniref:TIGR03943 family putative permease subunit n=1 Tax=Streptomyces sp. NBC_01481 TaxID=2975869 RepID=UPI00225AF7D2|nr:TIGR03943 family protein [Streptomyces sp. NBC_01481]MCX4586221.1 TIGR03943 family protein [Streptomyces sp. NBC_01481]
MNRQAQAAVLFLVGGAVLRAGFTDLYLRYVKAGLRPLLLVAGIVLIVAAIATVWYELRRHRASQENPPAREDHDRSSHAHREPLISWLLVLPLFALILVAPPALGSYSAMRTGTALQKPWGFPALPAGDSLQLSVVDYAGRAVYDHGRSLDGRRIKITGFVTLDGNGAPYLTRMVLNCCAADAQPVKIGLSGQIPPVMQPDTWLEVTGTYTSKQTKDPVNDGVIPFINISQARPVPAPHNEYEE